MASGRRQLDAPLRLIARGDKLWARELSWAQQHGMTKMRCPCNKCAGKGRAILLDTVRKHFILNGRHYLYRVWKGPGEINDYDEEWVAATKRSLQTARHLVDEGVHMKQLLDDLFPALDAKVGMENVHLNPNLREDGIGMVQELCDVMEELAAMLESMIGQDEGNVKGNTGDNHEGFIVDPDEDIFNEDQYLQEGCQPLHSGARSSMLVATLLFDERLQGAWCRQQVC
jgi:hypothetical protein